MITWIAFASTLACADFTLHARWIKCVNIKNNVWYFNAIASFATSSKCYPPPPMLPDQESHPRNKRFQNRSSGMHTHQALSKHAWETKGFQENIGAMIICAQAPAVVLSNTVYKQLKVWITAAAYQEDGLRQDNKALYCSLRPTNRATVESRCPTFPESSPFEKKVTTFTHTNNYVKTHPHI